LQKDKSPEFNPPVEIQSIDEHKIGLQLDRVSDKIFRNIKTILRILPDTVEILTQESSNELTNIQFQEVETVNLRAARLVDFYVQNKLIEPILNSINVLKSGIHQSVVKIKDSVRLISMSYIKENSEEIVDELVLTGDVLSSVGEQQKEISDLIESINNKIASLRQEILANLDKTIEEFSVYRLISSPDKSTQYTKRKEAAKSMAHLRKNIKDIRKFFRRQKANIWHSQSEARLFAKKYSSDIDNELTLVNQILNFNERVSPENRVLGKLPFYYQQLFLSKYNYQTEFWYGRQKELREVKKAISRHKAGYTGAIIITGEMRSGKSFFANYITSNIFTGENIYTITPPLAGSADPEVFLKTIQESTKIRGGYSNIFARIPDDSLMFFDDLELWWEKSETGNEVLKQIEQIIQNYSSRCLFVFTANKQSYRIINRLIQFERLAVNTIELEPFNSKELQEIILFRHNTSGFGLKMKGKNPAGLSMTSKAKLFLKIFRFSDGNVGTALLSWVANVSDFKEGTIYVNSPHSTDLSAFENLSAEIKIYLIQFILHKRVSFEKLQRITLDDTETIKERLYFLKRTGLINELAGQIFELNKYLYKHIRDVLFKG